MTTLESLLRSGKANIIDVRTPAEYASGHVPNSKNVPLQEITLRLNELKNVENLVLCCASGNRSARATVLLKQNGITCEDGGSWLDINTISN